MPSDGGCKKREKILCTHSHDIICVSISPSPGMGGYLVWDDGGHRRRRRVRTTCTARPKNILTCARARPYNNKRTHHNLICIYFVRYAPRSRYGHWVRSPWQHRDGTHTTALASRRSAGIVSLFSDRYYTLRARYVRFSAVLSRLSPLTPFVRHLLHTREQLSATYTPPLHTLLYVTPSTRLLPLQAASVSRAYDLLLLLLYI